MALQSASLLLSLCLLCCGPSLAFQPIIGGGVPPGTVGRLTEGGSSGSGSVGQVALWVNGTFSPSLPTLQMPKLQLPKVFKKREDRVPFSFQKWWDRQTSGRSGLLIYLLPTVLAQLQVLSAAAPFVAERLSQYLNPLGILVCLALSQPAGVGWVQSALWGSVVLGGLCMVGDAYNAGMGWLPLRPREDSYAVVTGASSGLGRELARELYRSGYNLVVVASRGDQLVQLKAALHSEADDAGAAGAAAAVAAGAAVGAGVGAAGAGNSTPDASSDISTGFARRIMGRGGEGQVQARVRRREVHTIAVDLRRPSAPYAVLRQLEALGVADKVEVLVHSAGLLSSQPLLGQSLLGMRELVEVNVQAALALTRLLVPRMVRRASGAPSPTLGPSSLGPGEASGSGSGPQAGDFPPGGGRILFVSSVAAAGAGPGVSVYAASKAFLSSFAQSLRRELLPYGVLVTVAHPGALRGTDFFRGYAGPDGGDRGRVGGGGGGDRESSGGGDSRSLWADSSAELREGVVAGAGGGGGDGDEFGTRLYEQAQGRGREGAGAGSGSGTGATGAGAGKKAATGAGTEMTGAGTGAGANLGADAGAVPLQEARPLILRIPGGSMSAQQAAKEIVAAVRTGRDAVTPGLLNKLYLHLAVKLLPAPALAAVTQTAWTPCPRWLDNLRNRGQGQKQGNHTMGQKQGKKGRQGQNSGVGVGVGVGKESSSWTWTQAREQAAARLRSFWFRPVIDYKGIKAKVLRPFLARSLHRLPSSSQQQRDEAEGAQWAARAERGEGGERGEREEGREGTEGGLGADPGGSIGGDGGGDRGGDRDAGREAEAPSSRRHGDRGNSEGLRERGDRGGAVRGRGYGDRDGDAYDGDELEREADDEGGRGAYSAETDDQGGDGAPL